MTNKVYRAKNLVAKNMSRMNDMYKNILSCCFYISSHEQVSFKMEGEE